MGDEIDFMQLHIIKEKNKQEIKTARSSGSSTNLAISPDALQLKMSI